MTAKRIFLTGASGCIGHYIAETLIQNTDHELFLLVRDPSKLKFDPEARPGVTVLKADLRDIEQFRDILQTTEVAILAATAWGGSGAVFDVNVIKTIRLMNLLNPAVCEQVLYFSTASILNRNNELLPEAGQMGTEYIRSKYDCFRQLPRLAIAPKITTLYPTLVLGGDANHPYSHLSSGLAGVVKWINLIRFFKVDAGFHFIHAKDIAEVVRHLAENPPIAEIPGRLNEKSLRKKVLGVPAITVNQAVEEICAYLNKRIYFRLPLTMGLANFFIALFRVQMAPWDRFCLSYRHFTHQDPVTPSTYGLPTYCATFADVLRIHGIAPDGGKLREKAGTSASSVTEEMGSWQEDSSEQSSPVEHSSLPAPDLEPQAEKSLPVTDTPLHSETIEVPTDTPLHSEAIESPQAEKSLPVADDPAIAETWESNSAIASPEVLANNSPEPTPDIPLEELPFLDPTLRHDTPSNDEKLHVSEEIKSVWLED